MKTRAQALIEEAEHHEKMAGILRKRAAAEEPPKGVIETYQPRVQTEEERRQAIRDGIDRALAM